MVNRWGSSVMTRGALLVAALAVAGCSSQPTPPTLPINSLHRAARPSPGSPIAHVVFIIQENRSFNNLFMGYPGATTQKYGYDTYGKKIKLLPIGLKTEWDIDHSSNGFFAACDGPPSKLPGTDCKMDGWNNEVAGLHHPPNPAYAYVPRGEIKPYWQMARQYVLADNLFASNLDASFVAHQYAVAAYASATVNGPEGPWGCEGGKPDKTPTLTQARSIGKAIRTCFDFPTLGDVADKAGVNWRFYAGGIYDDGGIWSSYQADRKIFYGPDWSANVINPPAQFLTDIAKGQLANVTWITPTFETSDHGGLNADGGPAWVASVVNAIGKSKLWPTTAIFILWDDWGGWFDPVKPIYEDFDGLGFRVPLLIVSPYAKQGSVTHVQYETSSVLRYIEDNFGLPQLSKSDARASDPANDPAAFDYRQSPRKFTKIVGAKPTAYWLQLERAARRQVKPPNIIGND
jgi:phospholipase C